jgi:GntR family transcriptional regulator/MocR family aminotransferase
MPDTLLYLDPDSRLNLQAQIRHRLVAAIHLGVFKPGTKLPSSRRLADQLGVARNTVVLACQQRVADGLLTGRPRSGLFVAQRVAWPALGTWDTGERAGITGRWQQWLKARANPDTARTAPPDARDYPFCFLDGQFDTSLFPVREWREACRFALGCGDIAAWSSAAGGLDDPMLVEELRSKILPRRGINARPEEILITVGAQQALYTVS